MDHPAFTLRAASPDDAAAITAMQALPGFRHGTLRLPFPRVEDTSRWLAGLGEAEQVLVAMVGARLAGIAWLRRLAGRRGHVGEIGMGVHDDFTCRRVGSGLLAALLEIADDWLGLTRLELTVYTDNLAAQALYRRAGFVPEGVHRGYALRGGALVDAQFLGRLRPATLAAQIASEPNYHES